MTEAPSSAEFDQSALAPADGGLPLRALLAALWRQVKWLVAVPLLAGAAAFGVASLVAPTFTATTTLLTPPQQQGGAASAIASLGSLANLAGAAVGVRSAGDQYVSLMQSATVADRIIDRFGLMQIYGQSLRVGARDVLARRVSMSLGKKDGIITITVDDTDPKRAADVANQFVIELRGLMGELALTDAQRRRAFVERMLTQSRDQLTQAQRALQASGFNASAIRTEPKATAEAYARLQAEVTAAEVRLQTLRGSLTDEAYEVQRQRATLNALREQLARTERPSDNGGGGDFVGLYREFKYREALFELYARQFELTRAEESRETDPLQVIDAATPPERKSKPKRAQIALGTAGLTLVLLVLAILLRQGMGTASPSATAAPRPTGA
jgi:uncharacterized protein involved in exopolysaccharide biosynthesis